MSQNNSGKPPLSRIKSSLLERSLSIAKIGLNTGLKFAAQKAMGKNLDQFYTDQAQLITSELGELKGSLMKAGQMLSMYGEYFFPPQANLILKQLQSDSPPVDWSVLYAQIESQFTAEQIEALEIDPVSIGTASMGQVHKAIVKATGDVIVLKIQYPGVDLAIDSDIVALKKVLQFSRLLPSGIDLDPVMLEIKEMLRQELDYKIEALHTQKYKELVDKLDPNGLCFKVPRVFPQFSTPKILATEFVDGLKADHQLVKNLSQVRRNRLAENFLKLYQHEIFDWNFVQTDPHLGNYKIQFDPQGNDRLVLLDFGATKSFPEQFMQSYRKMIKGSIQGELAALKSAASELGFILPGDSIDYVDAFSDFCFQTVEPFFEYEDRRDKNNKISVDGRYHWKDTDLPSRVVKKAVQFKNFDLRTPPRDILFLDRKTGGVFIFLAVLGAHINGRKIVDPFLNRN